MGKKTLDKISRRSLPPKKRKEDPREERDVPMEPGPAEGHLERVELWGRPGEALPQLRAGLVLSAAQASLGV